MFLSLIAGAIEAASSAIIETASKNIADKSGEVVRTETRKFYHKIIADPKKVKGALEDHKNEMSLWCGSIMHQGMHSAVSLNEVYVDLELNADPRVNRLGQASEGIAASEVFSSEDNIIILGTLGSGKTTLLQNFALKNWNESDEVTQIFIRFRDFEDGSTIAKKILSILCISLEEAERDPKKDAGFSKMKREGLELKALNEIAEKLTLKIILDGLDEAPASQQEQIQEEIIKLTRGVQSARFLLSSRPTNLSRTLPNFRVFEIEPLNGDTVTTFSKRWFDSERPGNNRRAKAEDFEQELARVPYKDLANRPLMLANLCIIFQKYGELPGRPVSVYEKVVNLCLEEWDAQRGVLRTSRYSTLDSYQKLLFLKNFAYRLLLRNRGKITFNRRLCEEIYMDIYKKYDLPGQEFREVARDIESTTGIINQSFYDEYEFSHKSIYEYLVGSYFFSAGLDTVDKSVLSISPNECAIAVALSLSPERVMSQLFIEDDKPTTMSKDWVRIFLDRTAHENPHFEDSIDLVFAALQMAAPFSSQGPPPELEKFLRVKPVSRALTKVLGDAEINTQGNVVYISGTGHKHIDGKQFGRRMIYENFGDYV